MVRATFYCQNYTFRTVRPSLSIHIIFNKPKRLEPLNYALWQEEDIPMSKNKERKKTKDYDKNFIKWIPVI